MDDDRRRQQQYGTTYQPAGSGRSAQVPTMGVSSERYVQPSPTTSRSEMSRIPITRPYVPGYGGYGFQEQQYPAAPTLSSSPMQGVELQYQQGYTPDQSRQPQLQSSAHYSPYGQSMMVTPGPSQSVYESMPQYQQRQAAAVEVLTTQFGVPQYIPQGEQTANPMAMAQPPYLTTQAESGPYGASIPVTRPLSQAYMGQGPPFGVVETHEDQGQVAAAAAAAQQQTITESIRQYREQALATLGLAKAGRLNDAADKLMDASRWLLSNVTNLDLHHDKPEDTQSRFEMWQEFNLCWEALGQKQKDVTQEALRTQQQPTDFLTVAKMTSMIDDLIKLCDNIDQYGLIDYEMGVWEEQIVHVFSQCLDLLQSAQEVPEASSSTQPRPAEPP